MRIKLYLLILDNSVMRLIIYHLSIYIYLIFIFIKNNSVRICFFTVKILKYFKFFNVLMKLLLSRNIISLDFS